MEAQPPPGLVITPMGVGEVLDSAFTFARRNFRLLMIIAAWGLVPGYVLQALMSLGSYTGEAPSAAAALAGASGGIISTIASSLAGIAVIAACCRLIVPTEVGLPTPAWSYREAASRIPAYILLGIIIALCMIPLILIIIGLPVAIYIGIRWSPAFAAIVAERTGPMSGLGRAWALTHGAWWHTAMVLFVAGLAVMIIELAVVAVLGVAFALAAFTVNVGILIAILGAIVNIVVAIIIMPFWSAVAVVLYFELRARAEGFDIERRIQQLPPAE